MPSEPIISQFVDTSKIEVIPTETAKPAVETVAAPTVETKPAESKPLVADTKPEDMVTDFTKFLEESGESLPPSAQPDVTKPLETKPEPEVKTADKTDILEDTTNKRDYSGIDESAVPLFKKMANKSFEALKPVYIEHKKQKELLAEKEKQIETLKKGALPDNYLEHERAYTLTPEFENAANTTIKAQMIVNHWAEQLAKIKQGDETYQELHMNPQTGELYTSKPIKATKESEADVEKYLSATKEQHLKTQLSLKTLADSHSAKYQSNIQQLREFESKAFHHLEGDNAKVVEPILKDIIEKVFPPAFHNNPLVKGYAKAMYVINQLGEKLKNMPAPTNGAPATVTDKTKAGPTAADMAGSGTRTANGDMPTYDEIQAEIGGRR